MVNLSVIFSHARVSVRFPFFSFTPLLQVNLYQHLMGEDKSFQTNRHEAFNSLTDKKLWVKTMIPEPSWFLHPTSHTTAHQKLHASKAHPPVHTK